MSKHPYLSARLGDRLKRSLLAKTNPINLPCPPLLSPPWGPECAPQWPNGSWKGGQASQLPFSCVQEGIPTSTDRVLLLPEQHVCRGEIVSSEYPRLSISEVFVFLFSPSSVFSFFGKPNPKTMGFSFGWLKHTSTNPNWILLMLKMTEAQYRPNEQEGWCFSLPGIHTSKTSYGKRRNYRLEAFEGLHNCCCACHEYSHTLNKRTTSKLSTSVFLSSCTRMVNLKPCH